MATVTGTATASEPGVSGNSNTNFSGVRGINSANGNGVHGFGASNAGVRGDSETGPGTIGSSKNGDGVRGFSSDGGAGVRGNAHGRNHDGVVGQSFTRGNGVLGWAENGTGVYAVSRKGGHGVQATAGYSDPPGPSINTPVTNGVDGLIAHGAGVIGIGATASVIGLVNPGGWNPDWGVPPSKFSIGVCGAFPSTFPEPKFNNSQNIAPLPWDIDWVKERAGNFPHIGVYGLANVGVLAATPFSNGYAFLACNISGGKSAAFLGDVEITGNLGLSGQVQTLGQDCAECFELADCCTAQAGSVLITDDKGRLLESHQAYDRRVVGVVSGGGEFKPGLVLGAARAENRQQVAVALIGRVACKVDASYAAIEAGDLLTTSATVGHAMKATDHERVFGCIIGKALQPLAEGQGMIPILVALQ